MKLDRQENRINRSNDTTATIHRSCPDW